MTLVTLFTFVYLHDDLHICERLKRNYLKSIKAAFIENESELVLVESNSVFKGQLMSNSRGLYMLVNVDFEHFDGFGDFAFEGHQIQYATKILFRNGMKCYAYQMEDKSFILKYGGNVTKFHLLNNVRFVVDNHAVGYVLVSDDHYTRITDTLLLYDDGKNNSFCFN